MMDKQKMVDLEVVEAPDGYDPIADQRELQQIILDRFPDAPVLAECADDVGELVDVVMLNNIAIQMELSELLDHLPIKWWKDYDGAHDKSLMEYDEETGAITEARYELIDALHFMFNIAIALGMDWEEVCDLYRTKQIENRRRQQNKY